MSYICRIKLGSVTNLSDARYAAAAGFDFIGFMFNREMPGYIPPVKAKEIIDWTTGSGIIGEFGRQSVEEINAITESLNIDIIEVDNDLAPEELKLLIKPVIKKIQAAGDAEDDSIIDTMHLYHDCVDVFSISSTQNLLSGHTNLLQKLSSSHNLLLEINPEQEDPVNLIASVKPYGICITGGNEEKAGIRDFDVLDRLTEQLSAE